MSATFPGDEVARATPRPTAASAEVVTLLNRRLADAIDLERRCRQAHGNARGPNFVALKQLFGDIGDDVAVHVEDLARRIVELGGAAERNSRAIAERSEWSTLSLAPAGDEQVRSVGGALAAFGSRMRSAVQEAGRLDDTVSAEVCAEISRGVEKWLRFLKSHLRAWT